MYKKIRYKKWNYKKRTYEKRTNKKWMYKKNVLQNNWSAPQCYKMIFLTSNFDCLSEIEDNIFYNVWSSSLWWKLCPVFTVSEKFAFEKCYCAFLC